MTTKYTESNRVAGWQYTQDLDAREALQRIDRERNSLLSRRRFRHESLIAWRVRVGLAVVGKVRGLTREQVLCAGLCAFAVFVAVLFCASLPL